VRGLRAEIADLVLDKNMNTLKNVKQINHKRRDLAQLLTVLRQKEMISVLESVSEGGTK
jgi:ribosomal protein L29